MIEVGKRYVFQVATGERGVVVVQEIVTATNDPQNIRAVKVHNTQLGTFWLNYFNLVAWQDFPTPPPA